MPNLTLNIDEKVVRGAGRLRGAGLGVATDVYCQHLSRKDQ